MLKTLQPSKLELLAWLNSHIKNSCQPIRKIEDLGNGTAYLYLLISLYPLQIRPQKIFKNPTSRYEIGQNLKAVSSTLDKLGLQFNLDIQKVGQMKYQDNFHLLSFIYKTSLEKQNKKEISQVKNGMFTPASKKNKYKAPQKMRMTTVGKESHMDIQTVAINDFQFNKDTEGRKLIEIQGVLGEKEEEKVKLDKISKILSFNRQSKETAQQTSNQKESKHKMFTKVDSFKSSIESAKNKYLKNLRPSLAEKSKSLSSVGIQHTGNFEKQYAMMKQGINSQSINKENSATQVNQEEQKTSYLLTASRKKDSNLNRDTEKSIMLLSEEKEENKGENLYPDL